MMRQEILRMEHITTYREGVKILDHAKMNLFQNEVLGIAGLNYSGKSALLGGINGYLPYEEGTTYYYEEKVQIRTVAEAREKGIFYIRPKSNSIPGFTVAENMFLKEQGNHSIFCNNRRYRKECRAILEKMGVTLSPDAIVGELTDSERLLAEICYAVANKVKILILDGVLSAMPKNHSSTLFHIFDVLRNNDISIILAEPGFGLLKLYCDRLLILRKGSAAGELMADELEENKVVSYMIGHSVGASEPHIANERNTYNNAVLSFENVYAEQTLKGVSFDVYQNEITGILNFNKNSGAVIGGLLSGNQKPESGQIIWNGEKLVLQNTKDAIKKRIAVVEEQDNLCDTVSLQDNIIMSAIVRGGGRFGFVRQRSYKYMKDEVMNDYFGRRYDAIDTGGEALPEGWFWRKKAALCRALAAEPKLLVMVNPTQYIDMVSKKEIYEDMLSLKKKCISVLVVSADIEEIVYVCDRMIVVQNGRVAEDIEIDKENLKHIVDKYGEFLKKW